MDDSPDAACGTPADDAARASFLGLPRGALPAALAKLHGTLPVGTAVELTVQAGGSPGASPGDSLDGATGGWRRDELARVVAGAGFDVAALVSSASGEGYIVRAVRDRTLPDFVGPAMAVLACGLNPSVVAADAGFGYAGPTNRFWPAALAAGLISPAAARRPLVALAVDALGMTDLVKRATPRAAELTAAEYRTGANRVAQVVEWLRPGVVLFIGLAGWRAAVDRRAQAGLQPLPFGGVAAYVMPSTSGLNAATTLAQLVGHMEAARRSGARVGRPMP